MQSDISQSGYILRPEEHQILAQLEEVRADGQTRVVFLSGQGGVGKTQLIRQLSTRRLPSAAVWVGPLDLDDPEYWITSNLEREIVREADPDLWYFAQYREYVRNLPRYTRPHVGQETIRSHLRRIKREFADGYSAFVQSSSAPVVILLDTIESVRGLYFVTSLAQWIKTLPGTLVVLAGRPWSGTAGDVDPLVSEFADPHLGLPTTTITLRGFTAEGALSYLRQSDVAHAITDEQAQKLCLLTKGHPLWMALAVDYLLKVGLPEELRGWTLEELQEKVPYDVDELSEEGLDVYEDFKRRLVTPYRSADFWHEAIKRLSVVRQNVNRGLWLELMSDFQLPTDVADWDSAWRRLLKTPWVRPRAGQRYVTLHDSLAAELSQRVVAIHDRDGSWREGLWRTAAAYYEEVTHEPLERLQNELLELDSAIQQSRSANEGESEHRHNDDVIDRISAIDVRKRELDLLRTARLHYLLLTDYRQGCEWFLELYRVADREHDLMFTELLCLEMQRVLVMNGSANLLSDIEYYSLTSLKVWLEAAGARVRFDVCVAIADYLLESEQAPAAFALLEQMTHEERLDFGELFVLRVRKGNASMHIPGRVRDAEVHFRSALDLAVGCSDELEVWERHAAEASKELGFYYRNVGDWDNADRSYRNARNYLSHLRRRGRKSESVSEELASIHTNWAYVSALRGKYTEARNLLEAALTARRRLRHPRGVGISLSVRGEVHRYSRSFELAWESYEEAEGIFQASSDWRWLGLIYQEQAICLVQASDQGVLLDIDPQTRAESLIIHALDICRDRAIRGYPSALNRAGRIFGRRDADAGIRYLSEGVEEAHRVGDGWFHLANLVEHAELCMRTWQTTSHQRYLVLIESKRGQVNQALHDYDFPDLRGRWMLLQAHLQALKAVDAEASQRFDATGKCAGKLYRGLSFDCKRTCWFARYGSVARRI